MGDCGGVWGIVVGCGGLRFDVGDCGGAWKIVDILRFVHQIRF